MYNKSCKMSERNEKLLLELLKLPENNVCADCGSKSRSFTLILLNRYLPIIYV